ncbi:hypothetical protein BG004_006899 [Podila humilis]|nr:hypothetical protein BG004_006899 [Podila humilis]
MDHSVMHPHPHHPHQHQQQQQQQQQPHQSAQSQHHARPSWRLSRTPSPSADNTSHSHSHHHHTFYQLQQPHSAPGQDRLKKDMDQFHLHPQQQEQQQQLQHHQHRHHGDHLEDHSKEPYHGHQSRFSSNSGPPYHHHSQPFASSSNTVPSQSNHYEPKPIGSQNATSSTPNTGSSTSARYPHHQDIHHASDSQQSMHAADTLLMLSAAAFMDSAAVDSARQQSDRSDSRDIDSDSKDMVTGEPARTDPRVSPASSPSTSAADAPYHHQQNLQYSQQHHQPQHHHQHQHQYHQHHQQQQHHQHNYQYYTHSQPNSHSHASSPYQRHTPPFQTKPPLMPSMSADRGDRPAPSQGKSSNCQPAISSPSSSMSGSSFANESSKKEVVNEVEDEDEEEDEVMSEGVVNVNSKLTPFPLSLQPKSAPISQSYFPTTTSYSAAHHHHHVPPPISTTMPRSDHQPGSPLKTPTTPRGRASKQGKGSASARPKTSRPAKKSQSDSVIGHGKNGFAAAASSPFLFSPFCSPTSASALSPLSFHAQLQMLTHNFVSIQPHSSPTNRFRRTPSVLATSTTSTPPFSPPVSPGVDLARDASMVPASSASAPGSANSSPTKQHGSQGLTSHARASGVQRPHFKPRWHTQPYMMFLALRAMPERTAARQELIMAAVELDKKFSAEKGLPRVFTGKTPMNSASACLTNNGDKYFIPFKPEGSRSTHFRLAYRPGDFATALNEYNNWMEKLVSQDWPLSFGVPREDVKLPPHLPHHHHQQEQHLNEQTLMPMDMQHGQETTDPELTAQRSPTGAKRRFRLELDFEDKEKEGMLKKAKAEENEGDHPPPAIQQQEQQQEDLRFFDKLEKMGIHSAPSTPCTTVPPVLYTNEEPVFETTKHNSRIGYRLGDQELYRIPSSLHEIVRVGRSLLPNAGNGLFAKVDLPASTPLGFYFGVPMTENEFDSLKDGVGLASQYSIMYRRTVLDATDEAGMPYTDPNGQLYCPFHFMNEDSNGNVSFITGSVVNQVICTTNRPIKADEELLVFFGKETDRHWPLQQQTTAPMPTPTESDTLSPGAGAGVGMSMVMGRSGSKSRTSSPTRGSKEDSAVRPRRETVYKPVRYTR